MNGSAIAVLLPEDKIGQVIEHVIEWYNDKGKDKGRVRIGDILREKWQDFLSFINPVLGEYAVKDPQKPQYIKIHAFQTGWQPEPVIEE